MQVKVVCKHIKNVYVFQSHIFPVNEFCNLLKYLVGLFKHHRYSRTTVVSSITLPMLMNDLDKLFYS